MDPEKSLLLDQLLKAYTFNGVTDTDTVIGRGEALKSKDTILRLRDQLIATYPKANTAKLRQNKDLTARDLVTVLSQIVRYHSHVIFSFKQWKWDKERKKQYCIPKYQLMWICTLVKKEKTIIIWYKYIIKPLLCYLPYIVDS